MRKKAKTEFIANLDMCQKRARVRTLTENEALNIAFEIERFLRKAPDGTSACSNWSRVASCYKGIPEGTYISGKKVEGKIRVRVARSSNAFGSRSWSVYAPGYRTTGEGMHHTGACHSLKKIKFEKIEDK